MSQGTTEQRSNLAQLAGAFVWLGGGHRRELAERHERSSHAVAGTVVLLGAVLAWLVASLTASDAARWPLLAVVPLTLVFGLLVGAVTRGTVPGPDRSRSGVVARAAVAVAVGVIVGELAALVILSSSIDHRLDERALRNAESAPAVVQATASLHRTRDARAALDGAVAQARERQDKALVVARCEYHPTPGCPQTRITGIPGAGPETRTANDLLVDAQQELDNALAARDSRAPELDATISRQERAQSDARHGVVADAGRGLGARWVAMNDLTSVDTGAMFLRLLTIGACALLYLAPLILGLWRGQTAHDRRATARADRQRAELDADTAIAIKRAEIRREAEILWAEHQLTQARLAVEAQTEIDREHQRRRVLEALEEPVHAPSQRTFRPAEDDVYLPIAAEAEAASRSITQRPAPIAGSDIPEPPGVAENLPAPVSRGGEVESHEERNAPLIPSIPDATKAAARWIRPLVPPFVARVIDTTTLPLRTARQVFEGVLEETEEITFALRRTRKVTVNSEASDTATQLSEHTARTETPSVRPEFVTSSRHGPAKQEHRQAAGRDHYSSLPPAAGQGTDRLSVESAEGPHQPELTKRDGPPELGPPEGPRQLPPPK